MRGPIPPAASGAGVTQYLRNPTGQEMRMRYAKPILEVPR